MSPLETFLMKAEDSPVISLVVISRGVWPEGLFGPSTVATALGDDCVYVSVCVCMCM